MQQTAPPASETYRELSNWPQAQISPEPSTTRDSARLTFAPASALSSLWFRLAIAILIGLTLLRAAAWTLGASSPTGWDDALYRNQIIQDASAFRESGPAGLLTSWVRLDAGRPPAYRILAAPLALAGITDMGVLRLYSLTMFALSALLVSVIVARLTSLDSTLLSASLIVLSPAILRPTAEFGTELALYPAIAGTAYFVYRVAIDGSESRRSQLGLALSIALGCLAKVTYLTLLGPMVAAAIGVLVWNREWRARGPRLLRGLTRGVLLAIPIWLFDGPFFIQYARYSASYERHNTGGHWAQLLATEAIGLPLTILVGLVLVIGVVNRVRAGSRSSKADQTALVCAAAGLPLMALQAFGGGNHNPRLIGPSLLLTFIALAIFGMPAMRNWTRQLISLAAVVLMVVQVAAVIPGTFGSVDGWDWAPLRQLTQERGLATPRIAYLGNGNQYNPPMIEYPWLRSGERVAVTWLWRYEEGPFALDDVTAKLSGYDLVMVPRNYTGLAADGQPLDNQHNAELYDRLSRDARFQSPVTITVGKDEPTEIAVFLRRA